MFYRRLVNIKILDMEHAHGYNTNINPTMRRDDYMMPLEILKAIELIDNKIAGLQRGTANIT